MKSGEFLSQPTPPLYCAFLFGFIIILVYDVVLLRTILVWRRVEPNKTIELEIEKKADGLPVALHKFEK